MRQPIGIVDAAAVGSDDLAGHRTGRRSPPVVFRRHVVPHRLEIVNRTAEDAVSALAAKCPAAEVDRVTPRSPCRLLVERNCNTAEHSSTGGGRRRSHYAT
jgi:hypothetical protein